MKFCGRFEKDGNDFRMQKEIRGYNQSMPNVDENDERPHEARLPKATAVSHFASPEVQKRCCYEDDERGHARA